MSSVAPATAPAPSPSSAGTGRAPKPPSLERARPSDATRGSQAQARQAGDHMARRGPPPRLTPMTAYVRMHAGCCPSPSRPGSPAAEAGHKHAHSAGHGHTHSHGAGPCSSAHDEPKDARQATVARSRAVGTSGATAPQAAAQPANTGAEALVAPLHNPADLQQLSEICACCTGALDVDELVGLKAAAPHEHAHSLAEEMAPRVPAGRIGWLVAAVTAWASLPGIYFGWKNWQAADATLTTLGNNGAEAPQGRSLRGYIAARRRALAAAGQTPGTGDSGRARRAKLEQQQRNLDAYERTVATSVSMQRFIRTFAGQLPLIGSTCMLASVLMPGMALIGSAFLLVYCASHATRYMRFDWRAQRIAPAAQQLLQAAADDTEARTGVAAYRQQVRARRLLYPVTAACFAAYASGVGLLAGSALFAAPALVPAGVGVLLLGLLSVTYLNNAPIKATFGKNRDDDIDREHLGDVPQILRRIGALVAQRQRLGTLRAALRTNAAPQGQRLRTLALAGLEGLALVAGYGLFFGIWTPGLQRLRHMRRTRAQAPAAEQQLRAHLARELQLAGAGKTPEALDVPALVDALVAAGAREPVLLAWSEASGTSAPWWQHEHSAGGEVLRFDAEGWQRAAKDDPARAGEAERTLVACALTHLRYGHDDTLAYTQGGLIDHLHARLRAIA